MTDAQPLRELSVLLQQLSEVTGLSKAAIQSEADKLDYVIYQYKGLSLVSPADFGGIIDAWAKGLKSDINNGSKIATATSKTKKSVQKVSKKKAETPEKSAKTVRKASAKSTKKVSKATKKVEPVKAAKKETAKKVSKATTKATKKAAPSKTVQGALPLSDGKSANDKTSKKKVSRKPGRKPAVAKAKRAKAKVAKKSKTSAPEEKVVLTEMELPKGYRKRVSNRYGPTLQSVLPDDVSLKKAYLTEIVSESNIGKSFLARVAESIKIKYRGKITSHTAYQGLLSKAQAM